MIQSHVIRQRKHGARTKGSSIATGIELPRAVVPMIEVALIDRNNLSIGAITNAVYRIVERIGGVVRKPDEVLAVVICVAPIEAI